MGMFCLGADCWSTPHVIHVVVSATSITAFFTLAALFTMAEMELNPVSKNVLGVAHSK
jgi:hypothetical protein